MTDPRGQRKTDNSRVYNPNKGVKRDCPLCGKEDIILSRHLPGCDGDV